MTRLPERIATRLGPAVVPAGVFGAALVVYVLTLAPTIAAKDSGELAVAVYALGIPHTTGYPLYVLLGKLFSILAPIGSVAYRVNLFTAVCAAAAWATLAYAAYLLTGSRITAALAGLTAAFIPLNWNQALIANVYGLLDLTVAASLVAFIAFERGRTPRRLAVLWCLSGLAVSHHRSGLFVLLPFLAASVWLARGLTWRAWPKALACFMLPFAVYLYVPLRGGADVRALSGTADTWADFVDLFTGRVYREYFLSRGLGESLRLLGAIGHGLREGISLPGLLLGAVGWFALARRSRAFWIASTVGFLLLILWTLGYSVGTSVSFITPCYLLLALWIGLGGHAIGDGLRRANLRAWAAPVKAALTLGLAAHLLIFGWPLLNARHHTEVYDQARVLLAETPPHAISFIDGHGLAFAVSYLQLVERARPDVTLVNAELSVRDWYLCRLDDPVVFEAAALAKRVHPGAPDPYTNRWVALMVQSLALVAPPDRPVCTNAPLDPSLALPGTRIRHGTECACFFKTQQPPITAWPSPEESALGLQDGATTLQPAPAETREVTP